MLIRYVRRLVNRLVRRSGMRPAHRSALRIRPRLEMLEDRNLLSTFTVDHLADDLVGSGLNGSLRYCINLARDGDIIQTADDLGGTINLTGRLPDLTHSISIQGPGVNNMTVRYDSQFQASIFLVGDGTTVSISGLTISNGMAGIENDGVTLTLNNVTLSGNGGAGIANHGATLTLNNVTVSGNGRGIDNGTGAATVTLNNSTVSGNVGGGGIYNYHGTVTLNNSTVSGNSSVVLYGGGIFNDHASTSFTLNHSTVSGNSNVTGGGGGGGIANFGTLTVTDSTISGNSGFAGGGIYNGNGGTATITDSTLSGNGAYAGGGILNRGTVNTRNTVIAGNAAVGGDLDVSGNLDSLGHNLIGNTQGGSGFDPTDLLNVNPMLGPLQDNGGPTQTMALLPGSPAVDAGDNTDAPNWDQRGAGFDRIVGDVIDIGAFEAQIGDAVALRVQATASATAGTPFDVTVTALDAYSHIASGYTGTVTFSSADPYGATLPADHPFQASDQGSVTFPGGATLYTAGSWDVTATDTGIGSITGSGTVTVSPAAADHLVFLQQPADTGAGQTMGSVIVEVVDQFGNIVTTDNTDTVTLSIGNNPGGGTLSGTLTLTVTNGVATFSDLSIDLAGTGYTLHATIGSGLPDIDSDPFNIT
jgi:hypothetical protein